MTTIKRYSEAFKRKVIDEIENGKYNQNQAMKYYGIQGSVTIRGWLKKYGKNHLMGKIVRVETDNELNQLKEAEKRIRELEKALSHVTIENVLYKSLVKVAERDLKIDLKKTMVILYPRGRKNFRETEYCDKYIGCLSIFWKVSPGVLPKVHI
ncbi:transposase [Leptospira interrogans serovar Manilae]|uniref:Transposase n=1 Tax=Leptospira interrogans serovar Manilae TaxID=214675 RepID=A0AAQ1NT64_LEPIR|nr:transposase [Leptospira interrogans]AKP24533.1 transposase [Leptospira interrogans serovar Manilae]AKP28321.1 transposase [Leptospira interrogans serovar Manilae]EYU65135.1 transposase [Leptospira interrogans serovar Manilae]SOR59881.1 transposase [Leptospira interrogans serovar Manilae]